MNRANEFAKTAWQRTAVFLTLFCSFFLLGNNSQVSRELSSRRNGCRFRPLTTHPIFLFCLIHQFFSILLGSPQIFTLLQVGKFLRENWAVKLLWAVQFNVQLVKVSWALFPTSCNKSWPLCRLCAFFRIIKASVFIWTHFAPILSPLKYVKCVRMKCSNNKMEQKRLSCAKSLCWTKSRVILRKFHFMYFLRHLPIKCGNQILKSAWFYLPTTLPITINKNTGSTYRITQS